MKCISLAPLVGNFRTVLMPRHKREFVSLARGRYRNQWGLSEVRLLLVENLYQYPARLMWNTIGRGNLCTPRLAGWKCRNELMFSEMNNLCYSVLREVSLPPTDGACIAQFRFGKSTVSKCWNCWVSIVFKLKFYRYKLIIWKRRGYISSNNVRHGAAQSHI